MKILVVNNHTRHLEYLSASLAGHEIEVLMYQPGVQFNYHDKDLIILSGGGGEGLEINDAHQESGRLWYHDEMEFVLSCPKPIIGICMGFEVIARAYGSKVTEMKDLIQGFRKVNPTIRGQVQLKQDKLWQYEAHQWHVEDVDTRQFHILADSKSGLEIIKHKKRNIIATQFHPEKGGTLKLPALLQAIA